MRKLLLIGVAFLALSQVCPGQTAYTNRLIHEKSPYLLQHAHNPVDWYPWGDEAFAAAKKQGKPIFLSVGYSTCHWCHVMEAESFSDPAIAKLINDSFIPIKVDREERPDIDRIYMTFVQATTGSGGWPMTVFLTPDGRPFFGGTYFPPDDREGMHGLRTVMTKVAQAWQKDHERIVASADRITRALQAATTALAATQPAGLNSRDVEAGAAAFKRQFDPKFKGFGTAPKFPQPLIMSFLFRYALQNHDTEAQRMALETLKAIANGGIHDQIGGGFHRYSTDRRWLLPHFEKMLYDQALLTSAYVDAWQISGDARYAEVARSTCDYVLREMTGPDGQFYSAQDADSPTGSDPASLAEGRLYLWTRGELEQVLGGDAAAFEQAMGVVASGNISEAATGPFAGQNLLFVGGAEAEAFVAGDRFAAMRERLLAVRNRRPHPRCDDKALVAWNGLMISALARAGIAFGEERYLAAANRAADFVHARLYDPQTHSLHRAYRDGSAEVDGFLTDYADLIAALLDLYEADFDIRRLQWAIDLQSRQDELFADAARGGYFDTAPTAGLLLRMRDDSDNIEPAGNSTAAMNLLRLSRLLDDEKFKHAAMQTIASMADRLQAAPDALPQLLSAQLLAAAPSRQVVLAGPPHSPDLLTLRAALGKRFLPGLTILNADAGSAQQFLASHLDFIGGMKPRAGKPAAYVCEGHICHEPTTDPERMMELVGEK